MESSSGQKITAIQAWRHLHYIKWALIVIISSFSPSAFAVTPGEMLSYRDPRLDALEQRSALLAERLAAWQGFGYGLTVKPSTTIRNELLTEEPVHVGVRLETSLNAGYTHDPAQLARNQREYEQTRLDYHNILRDSIRDALLTHADLLLVEREYLNAVQRLATAEWNLERSEERLDNGEITGVQLDEVRLELERAQLRLAEAENRVDALQRQASRYGVAGQPVYQATRFQLPPTSPEDVFAYRNLLLNQAEAEANLQRSLFGPFKEVRLGTSYANEGMRVGANTGIYDRRPGISGSIGLNFPETTTPRWEVGFSAEIVFDPTLAPNIAEAERRLAATQQELDNFLRRYPADLEQARANAEFAEQNLDLSERSLNLSLQRLAELEAQLAERQALLNQAGEDQRGTLEQDIRALRQDLARAGENHGQSVEGLYRSWMHYVRQVHSYLNVSGHGWELR